MGLGGAVPLADSAPSPEVSSQLESVCRELIQFDGNVLQDDLPSECLPLAPLRQASAVLLLLMFMLVQENVALGYFGTHAVSQAWKNSDGDLASMLSLIAGRGSAHTESSLDILSCHTYACRYERYDMIGRQVSFQYGRSLSLL